VVVQSDDASGRVEAFAFLQSVLLDTIPESDHWRECVRELHEADSRGDACQTKEIGNRGCEDEGDDPVDWDDDRPENLAAFGNECWCVEPLHEQVIVDDFDANVTVESSSNQTRDHGQDVANCLPAVWRDALIGNLCTSQYLLANGRVGFCTYLVGVLPLPIICVTTIDHIARVDEELCSPHCFEKVARPSQLRHELDEKLGTGICINTWVN